jgi:hypothetical protein
MFIFNNISGVDDNNSCDVSSHSNDYCAGYKVGYRADHVITNCALMTIDCVLEIFPHISYFNFS